MVSTAEVSGVSGDHHRLAPLDVEALYRREARAVLGMLCAYLGDRAEAEDVLQEAFLRVQRAWDRIDDPGRAAAYLRSTAFNVARSQLRRRRTLTARLAQLASQAPGRPDGVLDDTTGAGLTLREDQRDVLAALQRLPGRQRACVVLRYYGGERVEDIARLLDISENSVKTHLQRAMARLRDELEPLR